MSSIYYATRKDDKRSPTDDKMAVAIGRLRLPAIVATFPRLSSAMAHQASNGKIAANNYTGTVANASECIDLRSDTVTLPSAEMKKAMIEAPLGDDVYAEDPTILKLEARCANLFKKESALFVASGTMGNLISVMVHCQRGDEIIVGRTNHIHRWEQGNYAQLAGVSATTLNVKSDGSIDLREIEESIRVDDDHMPVTKLICLETTHNFSGGKALSLEYLSQVRKIADAHKLSVHFDGARIYNAAVALGVQVSDVAQYADSVQMCFSKGLGAPVGSIIVGSKAFIEKARRVRKALGGGWRQAGVLAAAAIVSLNNAEKTIKNDHRRSLDLVRGINNIIPQHLKEKFFAVEEGLTNIVIVHCKADFTPIQVKDFFLERQVLIMTFDETRLRLVVNNGVDDDGIQKTIATFGEFIQSL